MRNIKVLLSALRHPWMIHPDVVDHYALIAAKIFSGEPVAWFDDEDEEKEKEFAWIVDASGKRIGGIEDALNSGVAVINIRGAMMKYDYCGSPGTETLAKTLAQANENPSINSVLFNIDSPGGSVDGTQKFANAIKNSDKPVVGFVNGMMASAAMWIGSAMQTRIASSNTDVIGSIGTMASWYDSTGYMEKIGFKRHEVYATASTHKNIQFREAQGNNQDKTPNYDPMIKTWLDPLNGEFTGAIEKNLPDVDKTVLNGSHYIAKEAKQKGLIDKIGDFELAVSTAMKLGKENQTLKFAI